MILAPRLLVLIALLTATGLPARAAEFYTEDLRIPMAAAGPQGLEAFLVRPAANGRYPLALISHGTRAVPVRSRQAQSPCEPPFTIHSKAASCMAR